MTTAIIGAGNVGQALAHNLLRHGESVVFGVNDPGKHRNAVAALGAAVRAVGVAEAVAAAPLAILAVPYAAATEVARVIPDWQGKVLVDATNPLAPGLAGLSVGTTNSGAEQVAAAARNARVVKAFNTTGAENMADPSYPGGMPIMPVCADDAEARAQVMALAARLGFEALDCGPLSSARWLEPFAMTWIDLAIRRGQGRGIAFALLRR
ncbi:MAG: NADPH-dependent F420 reductase [Pseudomonadota bacterium]|jgi:predicted dinucleotide-binding enzyme